MKQDLVPAGLWLCALCAACQPPPPAASEVVLATLDMSLDPAVGTGGEAYECHRLDATALQGHALHALRWTVPSGGVFVHHAMMFATADAAPAGGVVACEPRPTPVAVLPLYAPGGEDTALADGVSLVVPASAASVFVELHLVRVDAGAATASVALLASGAEPAHLAGWVDDFAAVPTMAPHTQATATATCRFPAPAHVVGSWPHMHRLGTRFESTIVRADGTRAPLLTVPVWDFDHQPLHRVDVTLGDGDAVETTCAWSNTTDAPVMEGPFSTDEMCNQGLVVWPTEAATCVR
jgi:hypothetical protein